MTTTHTPGPWSIGQRITEHRERNANANVVFHGEGYEATAIAQVYGLYINTPLDEMERRAKDDDRAAVGLANARLIASAPDMLAALKDALDYFEQREDADYDDETQRAQGNAEMHEANAIRAAIARAEGGGHA